jgi:type VI secretion system protein ImpF
MPATSKKDRLSPPLMLAFRSAHAARDAKVSVDLRDEAGNRIIAGRRSTGRAPISEALLRREVARDLEALLNTIAMESTQDLSGHGQVRRSILNYGFPDIAHRSIDEVSINELTDEIQGVLMTYEPRLEQRTIRARRDYSFTASELKLRFVIHADLRCEPLNVPIEFIADVDIENGEIQINRL